MTFSPPEIPTSALDCHRAEEEELSAAGAAVVTTAEVCFVGTKKSRDSLGESTGPPWAGAHPSATRGTPSPSGCPQDPSSPIGPRQQPLPTPPDPPGPTAPRGATQRRVLPPAGSLGAALRYRLHLDPGRAARAVFVPGGARSNGTAHVAEGLRCRTFGVALAVRAARVPGARSCPARGRRRHGRCVWVPRAARQTR